MTAVTELREKLDVLEKTAPQACLVKKEPRVCQDLLGNLAGPVWTEGKEKRDEMESPEDQECREVKEVLDVLELLEGLVEEANQDVMDLRESLAGLVLTVVPGLMVQREIEASLAGAVTTELLDYLGLKVEMEPLEEEVCPELLEKTDYLVEVGRKDLLELLETQEEMALTDSPDRKETLELQVSPVDVVFLVILAWEKRVSQAGQDSWKDCQE